MLLAENPAKHANVKLLMVLAVLIPLAFAAFTGHVWEDFYITYRASRNLAAGNGLVFQPGERVHSFTSPLGVLVPALLARLFGPEGDPQVIWAFRALSLACAEMAYQSESANMGSTIAISTMGRIGLRSSLCASAT